MWCGRHLGTDAGRESRTEGELTAAGCFASSGFTGHGLTMAKLSLAKLERHLYAAADLLRGKADYQDYILGLLFLKRCSDVFEAERSRIIREKMSQGLAEDEAVQRYGENPDFYEDFFVPLSGRGDHLTEDLNADKFADKLNQALAAADGSRTDVCAALLQSGANASLKNKEGETALDLARYEGHSGVAEVLTKASQP
jgi:hypothetical protein